MIIPLKVRLGATAAVSALILAMSVTPALAATNPLTITPTEWNVVGLDSNSVTSGPNQFSVGAKVCNVTGIAVTGVDVTWNWTMPNSYVNLDSDATKTLSSIAANSCTKRWWTVEITRNVAAYNTKRGFTISASAAGVTTVTTPTAREIYVEKLVSQNRNAVSSVTGPTNAVVGQTVTYTLTGKTATQGYEQLSAGPSLDGTIFEILSVTGTYTNPETGTGGPATAGYYADACTWDPVTTSPTYRSCLATGKAGGNSIVVTVTALVKASGTGLVNANIYDYSGSSYHYNSDLSTYTKSVTTTNPVVQSPPVAVNDGPIAATSGVATMIDVPANDTDVDGDLDLDSVTITTPASHGTTSVDATTGVVTYTPSGFYTGSDSFEYSICDEQPVCDTATVTINVTAAPVVQSPPVAVNDSAPAVSGVPVMVDVADNDTDVDGDLDASSVSVTVPPAHGSVSVDAGTGAITYTADASYIGTDTFTYEICDSTDLCDRATVTINVTAPPITPAPPVAEDNDVSTVEGEPIVIDVLGNDTDLDGDLDPTSVSIIDGPQHGTVEVDPDTGEISYTPDPDYTGTDTFTYQICDLDGNCDTATVTVTVTGGLVNDHGDNGGSLATTGTDSSQPAILAGLLLLAGLGLIAKRRRTRSVSLSRV